MLEHLASGPEGATGFELNFAGEQLGDWAEQGASRCQRQQALWGVGPGEED